MPASFIPATIGTPPPSLGTPAAGSNPSNLQWTFDYGAALNQARGANKKVLVFFVAKGNQQAIKYEDEYFQNPTVRAILDNYVLAKIDFPQNTRLAYALDTYRAGTIVIADPSGTRLGAIDQIPKSPEDFAAQLQAIK